MPTTALNPQIVNLVPEDRCQQFLPAMFGKPLLIIAENTVYSLMERLSPQDYGGGFWNFYEYEEAPLFLAPTSKPRYRIVPEITGFEGEVSSEAAGIIATLFAFSHLSFRDDSGLLAEGYDRLLTYAFAHPEAAKIAQAID